MELQRMALSAVPWHELDLLPDRTVFQTRGWLSFLAETQGGEPMVAVACDRDGPCAYLTGLVARRFGLRMFGAPLKGWTTISMGFNRLRPLDEAALLGAARRFVFGRLGCRHLEILDPGLGWDAPPGAVIQTWNTFMIDLGRSEDELWSGLSSACRRAIRKARRSGVEIEQAHDAGFADEYYDQLEAVFARQGLVPTYPRARVQALSRHLVAEELLLLRAVGPEGRCIATGIFPGNRHGACFWGGASWREELAVRPNEALMWQAILHWKEHGAQRFDLGGAASYKRKYGGEPTAMPRLLLSRPAGLLQLRQALARAYRFRQRFLGRLRGSPQQRENTS